MAKADGQVLISLDIDDNTKAPIEKAESRLKQLGKGAGDELDRLDEIQRPQGRRNS